MQNPNGHQIVQSFTTGSTNAHRYAAQNEYDELVSFLDKNAAAVTRRDVNGWTPLSEAVRKGHENIVQLLLDRGSEVNARIGKNEEGGSMLWLAKKYLGENHTIVELLKSRGARLIPPEGAKQEL